LKVQAVVVENNKSDTNKRSNKKSVAAATVLGALISLFNNNINNKAALKNTLQVLQPEDLKLLSRSTW